MAAPPKHARFAFDEFYRAFSRSVGSPSDKTSRDAQVQHSSSSATRATADHGATQKQQRPQSSPKPDVVLPEYLASLVELQEPDGSWTYSPELQYALHGVIAPLAPEQSHKVWATAVCIHVWRQFPEFFPQLEPHYDKAMLHADESVLQRVKPLIDFARLRQICRYNDDAARAMRERLAKDAAAKRAIEDDECWGQVRAREREARIVAEGLVQARCLPMRTQSHLVKGLRCEVRDALHAHHSGPFHVDEVVESCWRCASRSSHAEQQGTWNPYQITSVLKTDDTSHAYNIVFLDGGRERERKVQPTHLRRRRPRGAHSSVREAPSHVARVDCVPRRSPASPRGTSSWHNNMVAAWLGHLGVALGSMQLHVMNTKPKPWNAPSSCPQPLLPVLVREPRPLSSVDPELVFSARNRAASLLFASTGTARSDSEADDAQSRAVFAALLAYDKQYTTVRAASTVCCTRYTHAMLYRDRFHAFDAFMNALVALMQRTVDALKRVSHWKKTRTRSKSKKAIFVWNGQNFVVMVRDESAPRFTNHHRVSLCVLKQLSRSLDELARHRELVEWYGEEFPLELNLFMRTKSLADAAKDMGLVVVSGRHRVDALRCLKLHAKDPSEVSTPTWWPEFQYDAELQLRLDRAEQFAIQELLAAGFLVAKS